MNDYRPSLIAGTATAGGSDVSQAPMRLTILGATGSIGRSTLALATERPGHFQIEAVTAHSQVDELAAIAIRHRAKAAIIADESKYGELRSALAGTGIEAHAGPAEVIAAAARPADCVMAAIVGIAGLEAALAAVRQGCRVALANKECLVSAGRLFMQEVARSGAELVPVDSEHSGVLQALSEHTTDMLERIVLTASGGPFRGWSTRELETVTPEAALKHPNWSMGRKISIDSATLMNKGLELIEAQHLFDVDADQLDAVIHPQSIVHALVSYKDGSTIAQLAVPDMRTPIALSLAWPRRMPVAVPRLDLGVIGQLTFEPVDTKTFQALRVARDAMRLGGRATAALNASNEVAVAEFLDGRLKFPSIANIVEEVVEAILVSDSGEPETLDEVQSIDREARRRALEIIRASH